MWRVLCLLLCYVAGSRQLTISKFEVPIAMPIGQNAELQCQYTLEAGETEDSVIVKWWWTPLDSDLDQKKQLYQRIHGQKPELSPEHNHTVNHIKAIENDALILSNLEPKHSGTYECEVSDQKGLSEDRNHKELIVYSEGSGPHLNLSLITDTGNDTDYDSNDDILVTCEANNVAPEPELSISINGEQLRVMDTVDDFMDGFYNIEVSTVLSEAKADGAEIHCEMVFKKNISHPVYEDKETYVGSGTTPDPPSEEPAEERIQHSASETLQHPPDSGCHLGSSLALLLAAAFASRLNTILFTT